MKVEEKIKFDTFAKHFKYCFNTGKFTRRSTRRVVKKGKDGYVRLYLGDSSIRAHRLAYYLTHNKIPESVVDHIDRVRHNNHPSNLRDACHQSNGRNKDKYGKGTKKRKYTSKYKGVRRLSTNKNGKPRLRNPYQARIRLEVGGKDISLGCYPTEMEAAKAYDKAAKEHFGEFACLNFPDEA